MTDVGLLLRLGAAAVGATLGAALAVLGVLAWLPDRWLRARPRGRLRDADVFVAFALGLTRTPTGADGPGESNLAIARWLVTNNPDRKPTVTQEGVYLALLQLQQGQPELKVDQWTVRLPHDPKVYVDTRGAALQCWAVMHMRGWRRPALISHDLQLRRMAWTFERLGFARELVIPDALPAMPFDARSVQHWGTRSRRGWLLWEVFLARPAVGRFAGWLWLGGGAAVGAAVGLLTAALFLP